MNLIIVYNHLCSDLPEPPRPKREVQVVASIASEPPSTSTVTVIGDEIDDEDEIENRYPLSNFIVINLKQNKA